MKKNIFLAVMALVVVGFCGTKNIDKVYAETGYQASQEEINNYNYDSSDYLYGTEDYNSPVTSSEEVCPNGYRRDGSCFSDDSSDNSTSSDFNPYAGDSCGEGYYLGRDDKCHEDTSNCAEGERRGMDGSCYSISDLSEATGEGGMIQGSGCSDGSGYFSSDTCPSGYTCKNTDSFGDNGTCEVSLWGKVTGVDSGSSGTSSGSGTSTKPVGTVTQPTIITDKATGEKKTIPVNAIINSNGSVDDVYGNQLASAGSVANASQLASGSNSGLQFCANGALATVCDGGGGGSPLIINVPTGGGGGVQGLPTGSFSQAGRMTSKCGTSGQFTEIGGVCFPANTGLSGATISSILANLFLWLMGLFTTLAVIAFVISGIQYLTSAGDEDQIETAKRNAKYALIGIVVGLSGYVIIKAISAALSGNGYIF